VLQLNAVVTLVLAVVLLGEPCTILQAVGAVLMVVGSLVTQRAAQPAASNSQDHAAFEPRAGVGFVFASMGALAYGTSPIIVRQALHDGGPLSGVTGGAIAYAGATVAITLGLFIPSLRGNVMKVSAENARWFVYSGIFVAAAQGFLYSALAVAPIMLVIPLLQLSLVFRFLFAFILNPHHEIFGLRVVVGSLVSIAGACAVAMDTKLLLEVLRVPEAVSITLRAQL